MRRTFALASVLALTQLATSGCGPAMVSQAPSEVSYSVDCGNFVDFGNGVWYYEICEYYNRGEFGRALSGFRGGHPKIEIVSVSSYDMSSHGSTEGYYIVTQPAASEE